MNLGTIAQAIGAFAVTNIDDLVVLAVLFGQAAFHPGATVRITAGQYVGFGAILAVSVATAVVGSALLPPAALPYFGLVPILLGICAAVSAWREHRIGPGDDERRTRPRAGVLHIAAVSFANGGDNIGVYVPIFAVAGAATISIYIVVFLICVAVWCAAGRLLVSHPTVATALTRWAHVVLPVVFIAIGVAILTQG